MLDWRIVAVVLVGLALITTGFVKKMGTDFGDVINQIEDKTRDITGKLITNVQEPTNGNGREIRVAGNFLNPDFQISNTKINFIVTYHPSKQDYKISVAGNELSSESSVTTLQFFGYSGDFDVDNYLRLSGSSDKIKINGASLEKTKENIPIEAKVLRFDKIEINNLQKSLDIGGMIGEITIQERLSVEMDKEPLELQAFLGNIEITPSNMTIDGKAKRVFVSGKDYTATVSS